MNARLAVVVYGLACFACDDSSASEHTLLTFDVHAPAHHRDAIERAAAAWTEDISCTSVRIQLRFRAEEGRAVRDGRNTIVFRKRSWCPDERAENTPCHPSGAAALTVAHRNASSGGIMEADIEINAVNFARDAADAPGMRTRANLTSVLTHELGHALGLDDTCNPGWVAPSAPDPRHSAPKPRCRDVPAHERKRTMYPLDYNRVPAPITAPERAAICRAHPSSTK